METVISKKFQINNTDLKKYLISVLEESGLDITNDNIVKIGKQQLLFNLQNLIDSENKKHKAETPYVKKLKEIQKKIETGVEINEETGFSFLFQDFKYDIKKSINSIESNTFEEFFSNQQ